MQAIILAGGRGERMRPFTDTYPKPMVPVLGKTLIAHQLSQLEANGIIDVVVYGSYLQQKLQAYLGDGSNFGVSIEHRVADFDLGSAGVIKEALTKLPESEQDALILYGDIFSDINLKALVKDHRSEPRPYATLAVLEHKNPFGVAKMSGSLIDSFEEKPTTYENAGIFVVSREMANQLPDQGDFSSHGMQVMIEKGYHFHGFVHSGYWWDVRSLDVVSEIEEHFAQEGKIRGETSSAGSGYRK